MSRANPQDLRLPCRSCTGDGCARCLATGTDPQTLSWWGNDTENPTAAWRVDGPILQIGEDGMWGVQNGPLEGNLFEGCASEAAGMYDEADPMTLPMNVAGCSGLVCDV